MTLRGVLGVILDREDNEMLSVQEYAYNACERNGTLETYEVFRSRLDSLKQHPFLEEKKTERKKDRKKDRKTDIKNFSWIYLGFEYCENMMRQCNLQEMKRKIELAATKGYQVAFVFPMMHQNQVPLFQKWILELKQQALVDEWIVNDLGTMELCKDQKSIILGRMFEKTNREIRKNIMEIPEIESHFDLFQPKEGIDDLIKILGNHYSIIGAEVDTFPDGVLKLPDNGFAYHVHYPDIYLSSSSYCEYAGTKKQEQDRFLLHQDCSLECCIYEQKIFANVEESNQKDTEKQRNLFKVGNAMLGKQARCIEDCVTGTCRVVYSDRIHY